MNRTISFTPEGHIHIEGELSTETIRGGIVLLTAVQVEEALKNGWHRYGTRPYATDTIPALYAVKKGLADVHPGPSVLGR